MHNGKSNPFSIKNIITVAHNISAYLKACRRVWVNSALNEFGGKWHLVNKINECRLSNYTDFQFNIRFCFIHCGPPPSPFYKTVSFQRLSLHHKSKGSNLLQTEMYNRLHIPTCSANCISNILNNWQNTIAECARYYLNGAKLQISITFISLAPECNDSFHAV